MLRPRSSKTRQANHWNPGRPRSMRGGTAIRRPPTYVAMAKGSSGKEARLIRLRPNRHLGSAPWLGGGVMTLRFRSQERRLRQSNGGAKPAAAAIGQNDVAAVSA